jgi:hypothetical protein
MSPTVSQALVPFDGTPAERLSQCAALPIAAVGAGNTRRPWIVGKSFDIIRLIISVIHDISRMVRDM